jgi:hypothetical protein
MDENWDRNIPKENDRKWESLCRETKIATAGGTDVSVVIANLEKFIFGWLSIRVDGT